MTKLQKLQVEQSEKRQRVNELLGLSTLSEEDRAEMSIATKRLQELEVELRAAVIVDGAEAEDVAGELDAQGRERSSLAGRVELARYVGAAVEQRSLDGAEGELNGELKLAGNMVPHSAITERRAITPIPAAGSRGAQQHAIIPPVYSDGAAAHLGISMPSVGVGDSIFTVLSTGAAPGTPAASASQEETTGAFAAQRMSPGRVQAAFLWQREDAAGLAGLEDALRTNLRAALSEQLDAVVIADTTDGLLAGGLTAPGDPTAESDTSTYMDSLVGPLDGRYAKSIDDLRFVVGPSTWAHMVGQFSASTGSLPLFDDLARRSLRQVRVSAHVPAVASMRQDAIVALGTEGSSAVLATWSAVELIADPISQAKKGQVFLHAVQLFAFAVVRAAGFKRVRFQVA